MLDQNQVRVDKKQSEEGTCIPAGFLRHGWNFFMPKGTCSIILSTMSYIRMGYNKAEVLDWLKKEEEWMDIRPFRFTAYPSHQSKEERERYTALYRREFAVKAILERCGFLYPTTIEGWIQLLLKMGLLKEVKKHDEIYLHMPTEPYPLPENELFLTAQELRFLFHYRQKYGWSAHA